MASDDKKRPWQEEPVVSPATPSRPPLKKRFTSNINIAASAGPSTPTGLTSPAIESPVAPVPAENQDQLEMATLPKEILLERMRSAKQEFMRNESAALSSENHQAESDVTEGILRLHWCMLRDEWMLAAKSLVEHNTMDLSDTTHEIPEMDSTTLKTWLGDARLLTNSLEKQALDHIEAWTQKAATMKAQRENSQGNTPQAQALLESWLDGELSDLQSSSQRGQKILQESEVKYSSLQKQSGVMLEKVQQAAKNLENAKDSLDECTQSLMHLEKRLDRAQCRYITKLNSQGAASGPEAAGEKRSREQSETSTSSVARRRMVSESGSIPEQNTKIQLAENRLIVDARQKELEDLKREQQLLASEKHRLGDQLSRLNFEQLEESDHYKNLQLSCEQLRNRASDLKEMCAKMEHDLDESKRPKTQLIVALESDKARLNERIKLEKDKLSTDHARVDRQRKEMQKQLKEVADKEVQQKDAYDTTLKEAKKNEHRVTVLETRLSELRAKQELAGPSIDELATCNELYTKLLQLETTLECAKERQLSYDWSIPSLQKSHVSLKTKAEELQQRITSWTLDDEVSTDTHREIQTAMAKVDEVVATAESLKLLIEFYEENEKLLLKELDTVDAMYSKRGDDNQVGAKGKSTSVEGITESLRAKAEHGQASNTKTRGKFSDLAKTRNEQMTKIAELRATRDKRNTSIMQLEGRQKVLQSQLASKELDFRELCYRVEDGRIKVDGLNALCKERRNTLERTETLNRQLERSLEEKARALEEEKALHKHVEKRYEKMKNKWEMIVSGDNPDEQELAEECDKLRRLLRCSTCHIHFRSRLLTRCMHTFCKKCIAVRLETRQRRCPSCGESFGANDVREINFP